MTIIIKYLSARGDNARDQASGINFSLARAARQQRRL